MLSVVRRKILFCELWERVERSEMSGSYRRRDVMSGRSGWETWGWIGEVSNYILDRMGVDDWGSVRWSVRNVS